MKTDEKINKICLQPEASLYEAKTCLERNRYSIVLVVDEEKTLLGTITDGDIRRAVLYDVGLDKICCSEVLAMKEKYAWRPKPVTASAGTPRDELIRIMQKNYITQLPLLEQNKYVADIVLLDDLSPDHKNSLPAMIMAGGYGKRLRPLTDDLPKPMLPVGGRPLIQQTVGWLQDFGINTIWISLHYKAKFIEECVLNGEHSKVNIKYLNENKPLGTAGALSLLPPIDDDLLVINGDIVTRVDIDAMMSFHRANNAAMTVGVRKYQIQIPYGVVKTRDVLIFGVEEKPVNNFFVNAGIYIINRDIRKLVPQNQTLDMPDLINNALQKGYCVAGFPISEYWMDIGNIDDYKRVVDDFKCGNIF